jgi:hypothetical protein
VRREPRNVGELGALDLAILDIGGFQHGVVEASAGLGVGFELGGVAALGKSEGDRENFLHLSRSASVSASSVLALSSCSVMRSWSRLRNSSGIAFA